MQKFFGKGCILTSHLHNSLLWLLCYSAHLLTVPSLICSSVPLFSLLCCSLLGKSLKKPNLRTRRNQIFEPEEITWKKSFSDQIAGNAENNSLLLIISPNFSALMGFALYLEKQPWILLIVSKTWEFGVGQNSCGKVEVCHDKWFLAGPGAGGLGCFQVPVLSLHSGVIRLPHATSPSVFPC